MNTAQTYNLRAETIAALDANPEATPADVAAKLIEQIPTSEYRRVVEVTLTEYVRHVNRERTPTSTVNAAHRLAPGSHVSSKVLAGAVAWQGMLQRRILTEQGYVALAQATSSDLCFYADTLDVQAARAASTATAFRALAKTMTERGVKRAGDLTPLDGRRFLGDVA